MSVELTALVVGSLLELMRGDVTKIGDGARRSPGDPRLPFDGSRGPGELARHVLSLS